MSGYADYHPIPAENLPARYEGLFNLLDLTFTPVNDHTVVRTITGHNLQLVCEKVGKSDSPVIHAGYQKAVWELREGHLRYCPSQDRLWRRDPDETDHDGDRRILNSWHPVKTIEDEYSIGSSSRSGERSPAMSATILREAKRSQWFKQVERGVRIDPCVWVRRGGKVVRLLNEPDIAVTQTFPTTGMGLEAVDMAERILRWLTVDEDSYRNLLRMFATPWLEPFKQLTYVLSGHGGDGKTLLMLHGVLGTLGASRVFPGFNAAQYCAPGGYTLGRESMNDEMDGKAFAYDDEAGEVTEPMLPALRALSTGSQVQARVTGGKYRTVTPSATIVLLTNMPFADSSENSDRRRFVKIEMHSSKGRSYDEYHAIERFIKAHPAALYAASCHLWEQSDSPRVVNLSPARTISDEMFWLINEIDQNEQRYGQAIAGRDAYRSKFRGSIPGELLSLLGLSNGTSRVLPPGTQQRVVRVTDRDRFDTYRRAALTDDLDPGTRQTDACRALTMRGVDDLTPIDGFDSCQANARIVEAVCDGQVGFAPCEGREKQPGVVDEKVSLSWRRLNPSLERRQTADTVQLGWSRYCVPPLGRVFVIDCDQSKTGGAHGFQLLQAQVGEYGGGTLPSTLAVRSPHGLHLYYRTPDGMDPSRLKNAVHPEDIPIDLRVSGKGYVLGPGSHANGGDYRIVDLPDGDLIPEATPQLLAWLETHEYTTDTGQATGRPRSKTPRKHDGGVEPEITLDMAMSQPTGGGTGPGWPDMTPIPEGSRNQTLHDWAYGRLINHPDNQQGIEQDLYTRGHASGLKDPELRSIWHSILRHQGRSS